MADERDDDSDREAILARRRRFIALALSGLAGAGCKPAGPEPCLSIAPEHGAGDELGDGAGGGAGDDPSDDASPREPGETDPGSQPFVEDPGVPVAGAEDAGGDALAEDPDGTLDEEAGPAPRPCLNVAPRKPAPKPCLKKAPPKP